jgi:superkiller protein 3
VNLADEHTDAAYDAFTTSIKRDNTYAPSFTSLGFYYLEAVDPPSHITATKFFQKAFELDEREDVAAKYLADEFAEAGDWDLVEVVARRVVQGDRIAEGDRPVMGSFVASKHAWAWKAIGAAELVSRSFSTQEVHLGLSR